MRLLVTTVALLALVSPGYAQLAVPNEAGLTYGHVHLNVSDVEFHKQLWVEHFGGVVTQNGSLVAVRLPGFLVALSPREPTGGSQGSVMDHFGFKVRNMEKFLAKWRAAGYSVDSEFTGAEGQANAYVTMPDGVRVELQEDQMLQVEVPAITSTSAHRSTRSCSPGISTSSGWSCGRAATSSRPPTCRA